jgi:hypothetical protein
MYCVGCGNELHEKAVICPKCGVPTENNPIKPKISRGNLIGCYIFAVIMPIIGLILGIYLLFKDQVAHGIAVLILSITAWYIFMQIM